MYHPNAFKNFYEAFDPDKNVAWAATKLKTLYAKFGTWESAVGYYHSYRKTKRKKYSQKVFNTLASLRNHKNFNFIQVAENKELKEEYTTSQIKKESLSLVKEKINFHVKQKKANTNSDYILARMEKVNFFRNYFHKKNN
jgi:chitinase